MYIGRLIILIMIFLVLVSGGAYFWWYKTTNPALDKVQTEVKGEILNINFDSNSKRLEVIALDVDKILVYVNGVIAEQEVELKLGDMTKVSGNNEIEDLWALNIPAEPMIISKLWANAYDKDGLLLDQKVFPKEGVELLSNLFWPQGDTQDYDLKVGQSFAVPDYDTTIKLIDIPQDSRCPLEVKCIQVGATTVDLEVTTGGKTQIFSLKSDEGQRSIGDKYSLSIKTVTPDKIEGQTLSIADYIITLTVFKEL